MSDDVNQVDVSEGTINAEWSRIAEQYSVVESSQVSGKSNLNFDGAEGVEFVEDVGGAVATGPSDEEKIAVAQMMINSALVMIVDVLVGVEVPDEKYERVSRTWAVVICKRYRGGIFEFLGRYKEELAAAGATLVFAKVVREGYADKLAEDAAGKSPKKTGDSEVTNDAA